MAFFDSDFPLGRSTSPARATPAPHCTDVVPPSAFLTQAHLPDPPPPNSTTPGVEIDLTRLPISPPPPFPPTGPSAKARRFMFYTICGFPPFSSSGSDPKNNLDAPLRTAPVDWCDSFSLRPHFDLERDALKLSALSSSFDNLKDEDDFHVWLATKARSFPLALLGSSRSRRPIILHNLMVNPDSGNFSDPRVEFLALDQADFSSTPDKLLTV